jgi:antirepressor protein
MGHVRIEGEQHEQTLAVKDRRTVEMLGDTLQATRVEDGTIYLPVRALCESLGLDRAAQVRRIKRDEAMQDDLHEIAVDTESGGIQKMQFLRLETVPYWLSGVSVTRVKPELRDKLLAYKRWVVRKVYEAFVLEFGGGGQSSSTGLTSPVTPGQTNIATLSHVRELGLALVRLAEEQMNLERQQQLTNQEVEQLTVRMNRASTVVGQILERVHRLEERTSPAGKGAITTEQAAEISLAVKAIAGEMARRDQKESNPYQRVFTALYQRYGIVTYKQLPSTRFADAMSWLQEWYGELTMTGKG